MKNINILHLIAIIMCSMALGVRCRFLSSGESFIIGEIIVILFLILLIILNIWRLSKK